MGELERLRQRVREAEGPDREIDAEIEAALFGGRASHTFTEDSDGARLRKSYGPGAVFDHIDPETNGGHVLLGMTREASPFTTSVDASLALVEKMLPENYPKLYKTAASAWRCHLGFGNRRTGATGIGQTLPLAILDALLTALIEKEKADDPS